MKALVAGVNTAGLLLASRKGNDVKLIIAAIKPFKLEEVREALTSIGVRGMMVTEIKGFGSQSGHTEIYRGAEYAVNFVPKVKLEIVVNAAMADQVVETIQSTAKTDKIGDGKIFVLDVSQAVRVRTGETEWVDVVMVPRHATPSVDGVGEAGVGATSAPPADPEAEALAETDEEGTP